MSLLLVAVLTQPPSQWTFERGIRSPASVSKGRLNLLPLL